MARYRIFGGIAFIIAGLFIASTGAQAETVDLSEGTMTAGGTGSFYWTDNSLRDLNDSQFGLKVDASFGYFAFDNFVVNFSLSEDVKFDHGIRQNTFGLGVGPQYFFNTDTIFVPYVGGKMGFSWANGDVSIWRVNVTPQVGVLISLNTHVALDLGLAPTFFWDLNGPNRDESWPGLDMSLGYFGVRAFF